MYSIIDTHCHLDILFDQGLPIEEAITKSIASGITDIIQIGIDSGSSIRSAEISVKYSSEKCKIYYSNGLHPVDITSYEEVIEIENIIRKNHSNPSLVAIGEIGIDLFHDASKYALQEKVLNHFLELAAELKLPVIIHSRDAAEDTFAILKNFKDKVTGVIHCFTYDYEYAKRFIDIGYYISFSGILTFKNAKAIHEAASKIPLETILIETDSPFLAPAPNRGKRNEPSYMPFILEKLFSLRSENQNTVERVIYDNSKKFIKRKAYYA